MNLHTSTYSKSSPYKIWARTQSKTSTHKTAILLYTLVCGLTVLKPSLAFWGPFIFFIITALTKMGDMLSYMLFSLVITSIASLINPILGVIISVLFLLVKISNLINNWRALLAGVFIYLLPSLMIRQIGNFLFDLIPIHKVLFDLNVSYSAIQLITALIIGLLSGLILHITLNWLYKNKYSAHSALSVMGSAPLIIILILLPFIISAIGTIIDDMMSVGSGMGDDFIAFREDFDTVDLDGDGINDHVHHVKGHYRTTPSGDVTYVDPHIRTNPNATITDNISFHK